MPDISVIVTAHAEGRMVHHTLKSARRAIEHAAHAGIQAELVVVLDRPTAGTTEYFEGHRHLCDALENVDFGDPGRSRNRGVEIASGDYLAFLDGDDLFGPNWLTEAHRFALKNRGGIVVLHPECNVFFGGDSALVRPVDSASPEYSFLRLIETCYWTALSFVSRDFFRNGNLFTTTDLSQGFGHEDWHWHCETIANGAVHRVVPGTAHFIRAKTENSVGQRNLGAGAIIRPTRLFDLSANVSEVAPGTAKNASPALPLGLRLASLFRYQIKRRVTAVGARVLGRRPRVRQFLGELYSQGRAAIRSAQTLRPYHPPRWLLEQWRGMNDLEPRLFPTAKALLTLRRHVFSRSEVVYSYPRLYQLMGDNPTHVYILPELGATEGAIAIIREAATDPNHRVVCISTGSAATLPQDGSLANVRQVPLAELLGRFSDDEKVLVLVRLLVQKQPQFLHFLDSTLGYKMLRENGRALAATGEVHLWILHEIQPAQKGISPLLQTLPGCYDWLTAIHVDSETVRDRLVEWYALGLEKFVVGASE